MENMSNEVVVGIDPGKSGGICLLRLDPEEIIKIEKSPSVLEERKLVIERIVNEYRVRLVSLENAQVLIRPSGRKDDKKRILQSPKAMLTFGKDWGTWYGLLLAHDLKIVTPAPHVWHRKVAGAKKKGNPKERLASVLYARFPELSSMKFPKSLIDTLGLALYAKYSLLGV